MTMQKDYKNWHDKKSKVHNEKERPFFHEREIWFCTLGENIGFEQDGSGENFLRPVVVTKKFNNEVLWCLPLTKKNKKGIYYFNFSFGKHGSSTVILSQIRLVDAKRLQYKLGDMSTKDFEEIKNKIRQLFT